MKTYKDHLVSTSSFLKKDIRKPIFRSSAIFPFMLNKKLNVNVHFLGYWLIKRNIKKVKVYLQLEAKMEKFLKFINI